MATPAERLHNSIHRFAYWKYFPNRRMRRRIEDVRALHDLLSHHFDDLEDIMAALRDSYGPYAVHASTLILLYFNPLEPFL